MTKFHTPILLVVSCFLLGRNVALADEPKAVYNYLTWNCEVDGNRAKNDIAFSCTINRPEGDGYASITLYENPFVKISKLEISVVDAYGKEVYKRDQDDMVKACGFGTYHLYLDYCTYSLEAKAAGYPYTVNCRYERECRTLFHLLEPRFQYNIPVSRVSYRLTVPDDFSFSYKLVGSDLEPKVTPDGNEIIYNWAMADVPALTDVDYVPAGFNEKIHLRLFPHQFEMGRSSFSGNDWKAIADWYRQLAEPRYLPVSSTPSERPLDSSLCRRIYDEVNELTRYIAISIGIGGWQPHAAEHTQEVGYGDCKDLTTLLVSRLKETGMRAYPALVMTRDDGLTDPYFPDFRFNHIITVAADDRDTIWMDPTCDNCRYGELPVGDQEIYALVVDEAGGFLTRTPSSTPDDNLAVRLTDIILSSDGAMSFETRLRTNGNFAMYVRNRIATLNEDETRRFIEGLFHDSNRKYKIKSYTVDNLEDLQQPVVITIVAEGTKPARKIRDILYCPAFPLAFQGKRERQDLTEREWPLNFYYPDRVIDSVRIKFDSTLSVNSVTSPAATGDYEHFSYSFTTADSEGQIMLVLDRSNQLYWLEPEEFEAYSEYRDIVKKLMASQVKFSPTTP